MQQVIEREINVAGAAVFIGTGEWVEAEDWVCPQDRYVMCQRLSVGHAALRLANGPKGQREVYQRVRSLGFMPSSGTIRLHPLGQPLRTLNCWFDRDYFEAATQIEGKVWGELTGAFLPLDNGVVAAMMERLQHELSQPGFGTEPAIEAACTVIAIEMARHARQDHAAAARETALRGGLAPWQLRRVKDRIAGSAELGYPGIAELAALCGISRSHFMRMFKASTGQSAHAWIAAERLTAGRHLLAQDGLSIKQVAARLGFSSPGHFTNAFQRHEGLTPSEFRQRARGNSNQSS